MSAFEGSYKSLLQGVSQQVPRERLPGQVTAQDNMLSDVVTNLRRRPGLQFASSFDVGASSMNTVVGWYTDIAGQRVHVILNTQTGVLRVLNESFTVLYTSPATAYLTSADRSNIQATSVGNEMFFLNKTQKPTLGSASYSAVFNASRGFFVVKAGQYSKSYVMQVSINGGAPAVFTYTTPNGLSSGDAALSTPEAIAANLANQIATAFGGNVYVQPDGAGVYLQNVASYTNLPMVLSTPSGAAFITTSGAQTIRVDSDLPATLPSNALDLIMGTGPEKARVYYRYSKTQEAWLESGIPGSPASIENMPIALSYNGTAWTLTGGSYEGRLAGDDNTNPAPYFVAHGLTGIGSFQGRLVLLAGPMVSLSASGIPRRFYRSTITGLLDNDPIEVGASANSSAAYQYCLPFQKDLLLFSSQYQALIPSGNTAVTPRSATVVLTSTYEADMTSGPVPLGRTVMYPAPRSTDFFGVKEMLPSTYTDSQYTSADVTPHLPKYMAGRCRIGVSSSVASMALFGPTGEPDVLIVHEYLWNGDEKTQQAWHRWVLPYDLGNAYFANDKVILLFVQNNQLVIATMDPRAGTQTSSNVRRPRLDLFFDTTITNHVITLPSWLTTFDPAVAPKLEVSQGDGSLAGEAVGTLASGSADTTLTTVRSFPSGAVTVGIPYQSAVIPTPPMVLDSNGVKISTNKLTILRYIVGTNGSFEYMALVRDTNYPADLLDDSVGTLYWSSRELDLGEVREGADSNAIIPMRTNADTTTLILYTESQGELNIIGIEYVCRYNQKLRRR